MQEPPWTFRRLAGHSLQLLRRYPVLVLPVLIADLLGFTAMHVQHALHQPLWNLFLGEHRSVLSRSHGTFQLTFENSSRAALLTAPLIWGCYYLNVCFYASAMLAVSDLLHAKERGHLINLRRVLLDVISRRRDVLVFSLLFVGLLALGALITFFLFAAVGNISWLAHRTSFDMGLLIGLLASIPVVYLGTGPALRIIQSADAIAGSTNVKRARLCGYATVAAQVVVVLLIRHLAPDSFYQQRTIPGVLLRQAAESLLGALPFALLFVAFSALTSESEQAINLAPAPEPTPAPS